MFVFFWSTYLPVASRAYSASTVTEVAEVMDLTSKSLVIKSIASVSLKTTTH